MRHSLNPFFDPQHRAPPPDPAVLRFQQSLVGYTPTPLLVLPQLAKSLGIASLAVKDESWRFGLNAYKVLGASWAAARLTSHADCPLTFAAASTGNHGRAVAWSARYLDRRCVIFLPTRTSPERVAAILDLGAQVVAIDGTYDQAVAECIRQCAELGWQLVSDVQCGSHMESAHPIIEGYRTLFHEADMQREEAKLPEPGIVFVQAGVGGLAGAAVRHYFGEDRRSRPCLAVVEPTAADCHLESIVSTLGTPSPALGSLESAMSCLNCRAVSTASWPDIRSGAKLFLAIDDEWVERAMSALYRPTPPDSQVAAGASGAAGLAGLMALLDAPEFASARKAVRLGPETHAMVVNTEGDNDPKHFARVVGRAG